MCGELGNRTMSKKKMRLTVALHEKGKIRVLGGVSWGRYPLRVKDRIHSRLDMILDGEKP